MTLDHKPSDAKNAAYNGVLKFVEETEGAPASLDCNGSQDDKDKYVKRAYSHTL